jgi:hypothetical protein
LTSHIGARIPYSRTAAGEAWHLKWTERVRRKANWPIDRGYAHRGQKVKTRNRLITSIKHEPLHSRS